MFVQERNIKVIFAGILLALTAGAPVFAADTELLLVTPSTAQDLKPNILFIIDTSTSMDSIEETIEPYDSALSYAGDCGADRVYWTTIETVPVCDPANTRYIEQSKEALIYSVSGYNTDHHSQLHGDLGNASTNAR